MTASTARPRSPQTVLGFTHTALSKLKESRELLDQYVQHRTSAIDSIQKQKQITFDEQHAGIDLKLKELKKIQRQRGCNDGSEEGIQQQQQALREKQHDVERELANFHLENKNISKLVAVTKEEEKVAFTKAEQVRKSKERIEKAKLISVEELTIGLVKYRELGLDFIKSEDSGALMFHFTKIDHRDADRVFEFTLKITDEDLYLVENYLPDLEERVVLKLVDELNLTEDYPFFMRGMRRAFKDSLESELDQVEES